MNVNDDTNYPRVWRTRVGGAASDMAALPDCDCACEMPATARAEDGAWVDRMRRGQLGTVSIAPGAYIAPLDGAWLMVGPRQGGVTVGNTAVGRLLHVLPGPLAGVRAAVADWPEPLWVQTVGLLLSAGVLTASSAPEAAPALPASPAPRSISAWLHLTERCTLACTYCYAPRRGREMGPDTARRAVAAVVEAAVGRGLSAVKLKYSGGEPLLNERALWAAQAEAEALCAAHDLALSTVLLTNAVAITRRQLDTLVAHGVRLAVSLDGLGAAHDAQRPLATGSGSSSACVLRTLDLLAACGVAPHISVTLTRHNLAGLPALVRELLARDLRFSFNFYRPAPGADPALAPAPADLTAALRAAYAEIAAALPPYSLMGMLADRANLAAPHARACSAGSSYIVIDVEGGVHRCQMDVGDRPVAMLGDGDLLSAIAQPAPALPAACAACPWVDYCAGGCPRLRAGASAAPTYCEVYRAILPEIARLEALRLLRYESPVIEGDPRAA